eukprot:3911-Alexandrium_andersonii.AAC.1
MRELLSEAAPLHCRDLARPGCVQVALRRAHPCPLRAAHRVEAVGHRLDTLRRQRPGLQREKLRLA